MRVALAVAALLLTLSSAPAQTATPFRYLKHEILVTGWIDGRGPFTFLLDTGTTPSVVGFDVAKQLDLAYGPRSHGTDLSGRSATMYPVTLRNVVVAEAQFPRLEALAADITSFSRGLGTHLDGILGSNFFDGRAVQIDYPCRTIAMLRRPAHGPATARFHEVNSGYIVSPDVRAGKKQLKAMFDTGNSGTIVVTREGIRDLHLQAAARTGKPTKSVSYGGAILETLGTLSDVRIGTVALGKVPVRFLPSEPDPFDVNIGNRTWERFVATFDYARGRLTLSPSRACS